MKEIKKLSDLIGLKIIDIEGLAKGYVEITFILEDDDENIIKVKMSHDQDCCEDVYLDDICGDIHDLIDSTILEFRCDQKCENDNYSHQTWTFYNIKTTKGYVQLKWFGESNGYYSEEVDVFLDSERYTHYLNQEINK